MTRIRCIILGAKDFVQNEYDGNTLKDVLLQVAEFRGNAPETAFCEVAEGEKERVTPS